MSFTILNSKNFNFNDDSFPSFHPINPFTNLDNIQLVPVKNISKSSFSISLIDIQNIYHDKNLIDLNKSISTINNIHKKFSSLLNLDTPTQSLELVKFAIDIFNEQNSHLTNVVFNTDLEKKYIKIILKTFDLYISLKGQSNLEFCSKPLTSTINTLTLNGSILYLSTMHEHIDLTANKLYHLVFCDETPLFTFVPNNYYPLGIDDFLNQKFLTSEKRDLKSLYFKTIEFIKYINSNNILWIERALKHSFSISDNHKADIYFLNIWHQYLFFGNFNINSDIESQKKFYALYFSLRNDIYNFQTNFSTHNFFMDYTNSFDVYMLDETIDIRRKNFFYDNIYTHSIIESLKEPLNDYSSWLTFHFSHHEKYNKWGVAKRGSIPQENGTLDVLFSQKYKKDYFLYALLNIITKSNIKMTELLNPNLFSQICLKHPEQSIYIIQKGYKSLFNQKISDLFFDLLFEAFEDIHHNQSYYSLDSFFSLLIEKECFKSFLEIMFSFKHTSFSVFAVLLNNKLSKDWINQHYCETVQILLNGFVYTSDAEHLYSFIFKSFNNISFDEIWSLYVSVIQKNKNATLINSYLNISIPLLDILSKHYETETLDSFSKNFNAFLDSLFSIQKSPVTEEFNYACMLLFKNNFEEIKKNKNDTFIKILPSIFSKSIKSFTINDIEFFHQLFEKDLSINSIKGFYSHAYDLNTLSEKNIENILNYKKSYRLLEVDKNFLHKIAKNITNVNILKSLVRLQIPINNTYLEEEVFNNSETYIYFLNLAQEMGITITYSESFHNYLNKFLNNPLFNEDIKKYLGCSLTIDNFKKLEIYEIESLIDKFLMKKDSSSSSSSSSKSEGIRKF